MAIFPAFPPKGPTDIESYGMDFAPFLETGESIADYSVSTSSMSDGRNSDIHVLSATLNGTVVTAWIGYGSEGEQYEVSYHITTSAIPTTITRSATLYVIPR